MLSAIKRYLMQRRQATLADIAMHLDSPQEAVRGMLERWIRKGKVRRLQATSSCGSSCRKCDPALTEFYQWIGGENDDSEHQQPPLPPGCDQ
jgi:hypothetical protein